jgi:hypothetical protein
MQELPCARLCRHSRMNNKIPLPCPCQPFNKHRSRTQGKARLLYKGMGACRFLCCADKRAWIFALVKIISVMHDITEFTVGR